jgi:hypothetical protein
MAGTGQAWAGAPDRTMNASTAVGEVAYQRLVREPGGLNDMSRLFFRLGDGAGPVPRIGVVVGVEFGHGGGHLRRVEPDEGGREALLVHELVELVRRTRYRCRPDRRARCGSQSWAPVRSLPLRPAAAGLRATGAAGRGGACKAVCWSGRSRQMISPSVTHGFSACPGLVRPAVARTVTASRIPRTAVAVSGIA